MNRLRGVGTLEAATGGLVVARTELVLRTVTGAAPPTAVVAVARILGARMLAQGVLAAVAPSRRVALGGAATDVAHAASMAPVIRWFPAQRRAALASAVAAAGFAAGQALAARAPKAAGKARP